MQSSKCALPGESSIVLAQMSRTCANRPAASPWSLGEDAAQAESSRLVARTGRWRDLKKPLWEDRGPGMAMRFHNAPLGQRTYWYDTVVSLCQTCDTLVS